jgi:diguanylate cyclase (GGDEF)-like protein
MPVPNAPFTIAVIDDDRYVLATLTATLQERFNVLSGTNADEAQQLFQEHEIDIVLCDQRMPGRSGVQLLEWVKDHHPRTIRLLMSGYAELEDAVVAINHCQVFRYLFKPWRPEELDRVMDDVSRTIELERSHEQLLRENHELIAQLEERVRQRTAEVGDANRRLEEMNSQLRNTNAMLEKLALTDELTGLPNRRAIEQVLQAELRRRVRYPSPIAVGLLDADHFHEVNVKHLHPGGDQVLIALARTMNLSIRGTDMVGRWGGEEFLVVAPVTNWEGAQSLAERIRTSVEEMRVPYQGQSIRITASLGFSIAEGDTMVSSELLLHEAAAALMEAKSRGRNCSVIRAAECASVAVPAS